MIKKDWIKAIKKIRASKGADPYKIEIAPFHDWKIVVVGFFVGLAISLAFNIYMSFQINNESFFSGEETTEAKMEVNSKALSEVLENMATKEANFEKIKKAGVPVLDPSL